MAEIIDMGHDQPIYGKQCASCKHLHLGSRKVKTSCDAFPEGVPSAILLGEHDHTGSYPGDNGISYEKRD